MDPETGCSKLLQNTGNYLPVDMMSHPRRPEISSIPPKVIVFLIKSWI
jgi:hypothetical protein